MATLHCYNCKHSWDIDPPISRREECPKCFRDAKVCLNCKHYDPQAYRECRESQASWCREKDKANFCTYFQASETSRGTVSNDKETMNKLEDLFKK